jgi:uncharacterized membrane protein SirB2
MLKSLIARLEIFSDWAAKTPFNKVVAETSWIIPTVQVVHILAVAAVLAAILMVNLRIFAIVDRAERLKAVVDRFLPTLPFALLVLFVTGLILIMGEPTRAIYRTVFWAKMAMIIIAGALAVDLHRRVRKDPVAASALLKTEAFMSMSLWFAVVTAGRWIGYAGGWPGSPS